MNKQQQKLLHYSYDLLALRRYTIREMIKKLEGKNRKSLTPCADSELEEILTSLIKSNFLNDKIFAEFFIDAQIRRKPTGVMKLKQLLKSKGIDQDVINQAINTAALDEQQLARQLFQKKLQSLRLPKAASIDPNALDNYLARHLKFEEQAKLKQKLYRYLQSNGFAASTIFNLVNTEISQED